MSYLGSQWQQGLAMIVLQKLLKKNNIAISYLGSQ